MRNAKNAVFAGAAILTAIIKDLGRFKVVDQNGREFEIHETALLLPYANNSPEPREIARRFAPINGTPVDKLDWQNFRIDDDMLIRM